MDENVSIPEFDQKCRECWTESDTEWCRTTKKKIRAGVRSSAMRVTLYPNLLIKKHYKGIRETCKRATTGDSSEKKIQFIRYQFCLVTFNIYYIICCFFLCDAYNVKQFECICYIVSVLALYLYVLRNRRQVALNNFNRLIVCLVRRDSEISSCG